MTLERKGPTPALPAMVSDRFFHETTPHCSTKRPGRKKQPGGLLQARKVLKEKGHPCGVLYAVPGQLPAPGAAEPAPGTKNEALLYERPGPSQRPRGEDPGDNLSREDRKLTPVRALTVSPAGLGRREPEDPNRGRIPIK